MDTMGGGGEPRGEGLVIISLTIIVVINSFVFFVDSQI